MTGEGFRAVGLALTVVVVGVGVVVLGPRCLGAAAGPEVEVVTALKRAETQGFEAPVEGSATVLASKKASFQRLSVRVDPSGQRAMLDGTLDFDGTFGETQVSSLGAERVPMVSEGSEWRPAQGWAPRLQAAVAALEARRSMLERSPADGGWEFGDVAARRYQVKAWYLRFERDGVAVTEDFRVVGQTPHQPVDVARSRQLRLEPADSGYFFPEGPW